MTFSKAYVECLKQGPFPGRIDPWAETGLYFQQIHSGMINDFLSTLSETLLMMGYLAGRERSLQIIEPRQRHDGRYTEADLSFPTLLTHEQRAQALAAVEQWMNELERLK